MEPIQVKEVRITDTHKDLDAKAVKPKYRYRVVLWESMHKFAVGFFNDAKEAEALKGTLIAAEEFERENKEGTFKRLEYVMTWEEHLNKAQLIADADPLVLRAKSLLKVQKQAVLEGASKVDLASIMAGA